MSLNTMFCNLTALESPTSSLVGVALCKVWIHKHEGKVEAFTLSWFCNTNVSYHRILQCRNSAFNITSNRRSLYSVILITDGCKKCLVSTCIVIVNGCKSLCLSLHILPCSIRVNK